MKNKLDCSLINKLRQKWFRYAPEMWWGDNIDVRFYLVSELKKIRNRKVLDIGCNAAIILSELDQSNYKVGVDNSFTVLKEGQGIDGACKLIMGDANALPFKKGSFDVIILSHLLPCIDKDKRYKFLNNVKSMLKDGGLLYITCTNKNYLRYKDCSGASTMEELEESLLPFFKFKIKGFNPFPPFPYFLPNKIIAGIPGIWKVLLWFMENGFLKNVSCSFFILAGKK